MFSFCTNFQFVVVAADDDVVVPFASAPHAPFQSRVATATVSPSLPKGRPRVEVSPRSSEDVSRI